MTQAAAGAVTSVLTEKLFLRLPSFLTFLLCHKNFRFTQLKKGGEGRKGSALWVMKPKGKLEKKSYYVLTRLLIDDLRSLQEPRRVQRKHI